MLKSTTLVALVSISFVRLLAQGQYVQGYFIDNLGAKSECLIKNLDWKNNPTYFDYKLSKQSAVKRGDIVTIQEFGWVDKSIKYRRFEVDIDRSSNIVRNLSSNPHPEFKKEVLFLKVLIEGEASLYEYTSGNLVRYFYQQEQGQTTQLIYKEYVYQISLIRANIAFRQQLAKTFQCESAVDTTALQYKQDALVTLFVAYNDCKKVDYVAYRSPQKKPLWVTIKLGLNLRTLTLRNIVFHQDYVKLQTQLNPTIAASVEFPLPYRNNRWSLILEPTYQTFNVTEKVEGVIDLFDDLVEVRYESIEFPMGLRYYLINSRKTKLFVDGFYVLDYPLMSKVNSERNGELDLGGRKMLSNGAFGLGVSLRRWTAELRYTTFRDIIFEPEWKANYQGISFSLGYRLY